MRKLFILFLILLLVPVTSNAMEFTAPQAPVEAEKYMPENSKSFGEDLWYVIKSAIADLQPSISEAAIVALSLFAVTLLISMLQSVSSTPKQIVRVVGALMIGVFLIQPSNALLQLGIQTVQKVSEYGKLLLPVMTSALAAQGGVTSSTALYAVTAFINSILTSAISKLIVPLLCVYIVFCVANSAIGNDILLQFSSFLKNLMTWCLKGALYIFSGFLTITGVVSGVADASAVKAAKLVISGSVPVVGKILSDASETILVSASVMKNTAGVYGLVAIIAIFIGPFLQIGIQYLLLKLTASVCGIFGYKQSVLLIHDFSEMMGILLASIGVICILLLVSTVCFMKGVT